MENQTILKPSKNATLEGIKWKVFFLFSCLITSILFFLLFIVKEVDNVNPVIIAGALAGLVCSIITVANKKLGFFLTPLFALLEGLFIGGVIYIVGKSNSVYPFLAFLYNCTVFYLAYKIEMGKYLKPYKNFIPILTVVTSIAGVFYIFIFSIIMAKFAGYSLNFPILQGPLMNYINVLTIIIASLNYFLDFELIKDGISQKFPKYMEWYVAASFVVTAIWIQIEASRAPIGFGF